MKREEILSVKDMAWDWGGVDGNDSSVSLQRVCSHSSGDVQAVIAAGQGGSRRNSKWRG